MFFIDDLKIKSIEDVKFNNYIYDKYVKLDNDYECIKKIKGYFKEKNPFDYNRYIQEETKKKFMNMPNMYVYGKDGSGKDSVITMLLENIYGKQVNNISYFDCKIKGYSNEDEVVKIASSDYHIIIEPKNSGIDKYIIQEIIRNHSNKKNINQAVVPYKIILIKNVDNLNYYAQAFLRFVMEGYYKTCRFILSGKSLTSILEPIVSRCLKCRVANPTNIELFNYVLYVNSKKQLGLKYEQLKYVVEKSDNNIKYCLWWLESIYNKTFIFDFVWKDKLDNIIIIFDKVYKTKYVLIPQNIKFIRETFVKITTNNIDAVEVLKVLLNKIIDYYPNLSMELYIKITDCFCYYERMLIKGSRDIIQFDALVFRLCKIFFDEVTYKK